MDVVQTLVAPVVVALFLLAAGYVFNGRLTRIETKTDRSAEQLAALTSRVDGMAEIDEVTRQIEQVLSQRPTAI